MPSRAAESRSMSMKAAGPVAPASVTTLRSWCRVPSLRLSWPDHSVTSGVLEPSTESRYWVGPLSASMVRSWVGWM